MGLFKKERTDGRTFDGQGEERTGLIDVVSYNGEADDLVWKFPYDNLSTATQLVVNQSQEAIFFKDRAMCDVFGPGRHTLSTNNIPILQKLVNLPFGGRSPFKAEVVYINKVVRRNLEWGFGDLIVDDKVYETQVKVKSNGTFGIQIEDSAKFVTDLVGTQHLWTTDELVEQFFNLVVRKVKKSIAAYMIREKVSILDINNLLDEISTGCRRAVSEEFADYGIRIVSFDVAEINYDQDDENVRLIFQKRAEKRGLIFEAEGLAESRRIQGTTYQQERQLDVMETAAGNEGGAGQMMGAGMGLGMGMGVGAAFGQQMGNMAGVMNQGPVYQQPGTVPPPPPASSVFHVLLGGTQQGPFDLPTLAQLAGRGQFLRDTLVWKAGMPQWAPAGELPELQHLFAAAPPAPPSI